MTGGTATVGGGRREGDWQAWEASCLLCCFLVGVWEWVKRAILGDLLQLDGVTAWEWTKEEWDGSGRSSGRCDLAAGV